MKNPGRVNQQVVSPCSMTKEIMRCPKDKEKQGEKRGDADRFILERWIRTGYVLQRARVHFFQPLVKIADRINRQAVDPDLIMHMRPGTRPGIPGIRDYVAALHVLTHLDV